MHSIRAAAPSDADGLAEVARQTFRDGWASVIGDDLARLYGDTYLNAGTLSGEIADTDDNFFALAVTEESAIVGYVKLDLARPAPTCVTGAYPVLLARLYVAANGRGTGLADALFAAAIDEALRRGWATFWLECDTRNERAWRFYDRRGFVTVGRSVYVLPIGTNDNISIMMRPITQEPASPPANG